MPEGFLGAKWLMTKSEVSRIRPDAAAISETELIEFVELFDRTTTVVYVFDDDALLMVYVTFPAPSSVMEYKSAHEYIEQEFGTMSEPRAAPASNLRLVSEREIGRVQIQHILREDSGTLVQQLLVYRTPADQ